LDLGFQIDDLGFVKVAKRLAQSALPFEICNFGLTCY